VALRCCSRILLLALLAVPSCARLLPPLVKPYQRVHLSDRIMRTDADKLGRAADQHVLGTREGAFGGNGTTGGGCGCN
jgi:hypothetical protein